jgi:hypothetical protein
VLNRNAELNTVVLIRLKIHMDINKQQSYTKEKDMNNVLFVDAGKEMISR